MNHSSDKVLIVRTDRLGDVVLTLPMARAIKAVMPEAHVSFLVREYTQPIVERSPDVNEVLVAEDKLGLIGLIRQIRQAKAKVIFLPSPRFPLAFASWLARVPVRVGTGYRWYSFLFNHRVFEHRKTAEHHESEYNLRMLRQIGIESNPMLLPDIQIRSEDLAFTQVWLREHLDSADSRFVVLHTTSGGSSHEWSSERFIELGQQLRSELGCAVVLTGIENERPKLTAMSASIDAQLFIGHSILELAALLSQASAVVSASTGPGHLAAALGTPAVGLFPLPLAISARRWGLRGPKAVNLSPEPIDGCPNCTPCTCMERISVERVVSEVTAVS